MIQAYTTAAGKIILLEKQLGSGGEGEVWTVQGSLEVAKIYHVRNLKPELERKLKAMVANPPVDEMRVRGHVSIAWPTELLTQGGKFAGFLMPRLEQSPTIFTVYNPLKRKKACPGFNWKYLLHTALNLCKAVEAIHYKKYVIGDLNELNVLVKSSALVSIIDTDSFQVQDSNGQIYHCKVGKEDFMPPELLGAALDKVDRLPEHDYFSLGVLIFRLLMEGYYPYTGVLKQEIGLNEAVQSYCLKKGAFPYAPNPLVSPPLMAPPFEILPRDVRSLFLRCFVAGHKNLQARPSPHDWARVLEKAERNLAICKVNAEHVYARHLNDCPWCAREQVKPKILLQTPLPILPNPPRSSPAPATTPATALGLFSPTPVTPAFVLPTLPVSRSQWQSFQRKLKSLGDGVGRFFRSPGGRVNGRIWWMGTRKYILWGGAAGLGLFLLLYLVYWSPIEVGYLAGILTAGLLGVSIFMIVRTLWQKVPRMAKGISVAVLIAGGIASVLLGYQVAKGVGHSLFEWTPPAGILFLDSFLVAMFGGTAYGNYQTLSRRKSLALASLTSLLLAASPFGLIALLSLLGVPLPW